MNLISITLTSSFNHGQKLSRLTFNDGDGTMKETSVKYTGQSCFDRNDAVEIEVDDFAPLFIIDRDINSTASKYAKPANHGGQCFLQAIVYHIKKNKLKAKVYFDIGGTGKYEMVSWDKDPMAFAIAWVSYTMGGIHTCEVYTLKDRAEFYDNLTERAVNIYGVVQDKARAILQINWALSDDVSLAVKWLKNNRTDYIQSVSPREIKNARFKYNNECRENISGPRFTSALEVMDILTTQ